MTLLYLVSAASMAFVGATIDRFGPRPVVLVGAVTLAVGVTCVGRTQQPWQVYLSFASIGIVWSCLSMTAISTTLAPWFHRYQGRAVSIASLGASGGGMIGAPLLLLGIDRVGFPATTMLASVVELALLLPLAVFVLRRGPEEMGLFPDGQTDFDTTPPVQASRWSRKDAANTRQFRTVVVAFGIGMAVQIGFLTHQVAYLVPSLGISGAAATVTTTAAFALLGRLLLAGFADGIDARIGAGAVLVLAAASLAVLAIYPAPATIIPASAAFGLSVGNVTTLAPIIVRREFGAISFGSVYGVAATCVQIATALGPSLYGVLHEIFGGYGAPLLVAAALVVLGRGRPRSA